MCLAVVSEVQVPDLVNHRRAEDLVRISLRAPGDLFHRRIKDVDALNPVRVALLFLAATRAFGSALFALLKGALGSAEEAVRIAFGLNLLITEKNAREEVLTSIRSMLEMKPDPLKRQCNRLKALRAFAKDGDWPTLAQALGIP